MRPAAAHGMRIDKDKNTCDLIVARKRKRPDGGTPGAHSSQILVASRVMIENPVDMRVSAATTQ